MQNNNNLVSLLPHGSGIDYDWNFTVESAESVIASNGWHYMSQNGYYIGCVEFSVRINADGTVESPKFPDIEELAKTEIGKDIAIDFYQSESDEEVTEVSHDDILNALMNELFGIGMCISQTFDCSIDKDSLAKAVSEYIKEEAEHEYEVPGFWGFYCSAYTENSDLEYFFFDDYESLDSHTKELYKEFMNRKADYSYDDDFLNNVCKTYIENFDNNMREVIKSWGTSEFTLLQMPRYYNFETDRVFAKMIFGEDVENEIQDYLESHKEQFAEYIRKRFTSYDGYFSNYSNDINDWQMPISKMDYNEIGAILHFILHNEGYDMNDINYQTIEELAGRGEDYDFFIVNKNQHNLYDFLYKNGGNI